MDWIKTIDAAITYMEEHLTEEIKLNDIAVRISISQFHFQRALKVLSEEGLY